MDDLKLIKKHYGEDMAHLCRELFPSLLETKGLLFKLLSDNFQYSKFLCEDIYGGDLKYSFQNYIYDLSQKKNEVINEDVKDPYELMKEAGYTLYRCITEEDIQKFRKYYAVDEELCTFKGGRLKSCDVFFAVKDNVDEIKREDYSKPEREDEYGTSVISIQFSKGNHYLSIKNRYNHTVNNPDATFGNNLNNIIPGLNSSFQKYFGYKINYESGDFYYLFTDCCYVQDANGKFYSYNYSIDTSTVPAYFGYDNVIVQNGKVLEKFLDKNRYLVFDYYILDLKDKKIITTLKENNVLDIKDSLPKVINELEIDKIQIEKKDDGKKDIILMKDDKKIVFTISKRNQIIEYYDEINEKLPVYFLADILELKRVMLKNVVSIGECFNLHGAVKEFIAPKLVSVDDCFLSFVKYVELPLLEKLGNHALSHFCGEEVSLPSLRSTGDYFLSSAKRINKVDFPNLEYTGTRFLGSNNLKSISLPKIKEMGDRSFEYSPRIKKFIVPRLKSLPRDFLDIDGKKSIEIICIRDNNLDNMRFAIRKFKNLEKYNGEDVKKLKLNK